MTDPATRMKDAGRSWTDIAEALGITVAEAKERVQEDKKARRVDLARSQPAEDRNGLRDVCSYHWCGHMRKEHDRDTKVCLVCGPERRLWRVIDQRDGQDLDYLLDQEERPETPADATDENWDVRPEWRGCDEFFHSKRNTGLPWWRLPQEEDPHYIDPDTKLHDGVAIQARQLGVQRKVAAGWLGRHRFVPEIQQPTLETLTRRARKKLKRGKKLKRHYDAPGKNDRI